MYAAPGSAVTARLGRSGQSNVQDAVLPSTQVFDQRLAEATVASVANSVLDLNAKYTARIDAVFPRSQRYVLTGDRCLLGISLENEKFSHEKLEAMLIWISRRFLRCDVLIGDSLHRLTLEASGTVIESLALDKALALGQEFIEKNNQLFERFSQYTDFHFAKCSAIQQFPDYQGRYDELVEFFNSDAIFNLSVRKFGESYHTRNARNCAAAELQRRIENSSRYFLEEFAIMGCLQSRNDSIFIYPGTLVSLAEIISGSHPAAPDALKNMVAISLAFKKSVSESNGIIFPLKSL